MKQAFLVLTLLFTRFCFSQNPKITRHGNDTIEVVSYHKNGRVKDSVWKTIEVLVGKPDKIDPKHPGDSIVMNIETPFGTAKSFYKKGHLKSITHYGTPNITYEYRKNGQLSSYHEFPYGYKKTYNKKGKQIRQSDHNKKKFVKVPKNYRKQGDLNNTPYASGLSTPDLILENGNNNKNIKPGSNVSFCFTNDTTIMRHCVYEGRYKDSLVFSIYDYDVTDSKNTLKLARVVAVHANELQRILYATKNLRKTHTTASFMEVAGFNMTFLTVVGGAVFFGAAVLVQPAVAATAIAGIPVYIISKQVFKKTVPKTYLLSEWKIKN